MKKEDISSEELISDLAALTMIAEMFQHDERAVERIANIVNVILQQPNIVEFSAEDVVIFLEEKYGVK